jgi:hypothetical protein
MERFANRKRGGAPPIARVLLGPARLRTGEVSVFFRARGEDGTVFVEDDGPCSACADVDAEDGNTASFLNQTCAKFAREAVSDTCLVRERLIPTAQKQSTNGFRERSRWTFKTTSIGLSTLRGRAAEKVVNMEEQLTRPRVEHTMPARKFVQD